MKIIYTALLLLGTTSTLTAQDKIEKANSSTAIELKPVQLCGKDLQWKDAPPPLPPGAKVAVVEGNAKTNRHFTIRMKFPPYFKILPHTHPVDERTTVISGAMSIGLGDVMDTTQATRFDAGCFYLNPAGIHHYAFTSELETIIQISTNGPWGLHYLNEAESR